MKSIKKLSVATIVAILLCSMAVATAFATTDVKDEKKNNEITIESKEKKVSSYKIKWDYNGGKIGNKKTKITTVKKGSKIGKLVATPKKSGYSFKGWYTKKNGGTKISKNTKPKKSVTYFAKWTKLTKTSTKSSEVVGTWETFWRPGKYMFSENGRFLYQAETHSKVGDYKVSKGKITFTNIVVVWNSGIKEKYHDTIIEYRLGTETNDAGKVFKTIEMARLDYPDKSYLPLSFIWDRFTKMNDLG